MNGDISIVVMVFYNLFIPGGGTTLLWHLLSISLLPAFHRPPLKQPGSAAPEPHAPDRNNCG